MARNAVVGPQMVHGGSVKWFNAVKGFGFILTDDGQEVYVHYSQIRTSGFRKLKTGERVEFEVGRGPKGLFASNVVQESPQPVESTA